ncbi:hypothetical protein KFL_001080040 [Klebsormidium nitens]|uniref:Uncharacterized protein n=1 Tax=Klebsormidium nitens TaxID=105231 RepID=A0A1Y1I2H4_KLENI|nr:hypothetical protein KFL_001080040 [Klebsormidium nitens]|eukprot:GAQ82328.1 hypothetical protein KFL_001080040 [Klebsormidium nitens]
MSGSEARERLYYLLEVLFARADIRDVGAAIEGLKELAALLPEHYIGPQWEGHPPGQTILGRGRALSPLVHYFAKQGKDENGVPFVKGQEEGGSRIAGLTQAEFDALDESMQQQVEMAEELKYELDRLKAKLKAATESVEPQSVTEEDFVFRVAPGGSEFVRVGGAQSAPGQQQGVESASAEVPPGERLSEIGLQEKGESLPPTPVPRPAPIPPPPSSVFRQSDEHDPSPSSSDHVADGAEQSAGEKESGTLDSQDDDEEELEQVLSRMGRYKTGVGSAFQTSTALGAENGRPNPSLVDPSLPGLADPPGLTGGLWGANPAGFDSPNPPASASATSPSISNDLFQVLFETPNSPRLSDGKAVDQSADVVVWEEEPLERVAADAQFLLGVLASTGIASDFVPRNETQALGYYRRAAEGGAQQAQLALAHWYHQGYHVDSSCSSALWYLRGVADSIMTSAQEVGDVVLPRAPVRLRDRERDASAAMNDMFDLDAPDQVAWDEDLALRGVAEAQRHVGYRRLLGRGVDQDVHEARRYFEAAAGAGDPYAAFNLGYMYMRGIAHPVNYTAARELFEYAAEDDLPAAYNGLGVLYYSGWGVPQNFTKAKEYFELGAVFQDPDSLYNLGSLYMGGFGVPEDLPKAYAYIQNASHAGHWKAPHTLGVMHAEGTGVEKNCSQAVQFLTLFISERGQWPDELEEAFAYTGSDEWSALLRYLIMAEQGSHVACANAAFILRKSKEYTHSDHHELALNLLERTRDSETNLRSGALIDAGNLHYYGRVQITEPDERSGSVSGSHVALQYYEEAAESNDPEALYSLAWVYEHGELGQPRDHHKALDLLDEAMEHAYLEELLPLAVALTYFQSHDIYLRVVGFAERSKRGFVGALEGVVAQGDTILLLVLSTILFWVVARLRRRLDQVEHRTLAARTIEVSGEESQPESVAGRAAVSPSSSPSAFASKGVPHNAVRFGTAGSGKVLDARGNFYECSIPSPSSDISTHPSHKLWRTPWMW